MHRRPAWDPVFSRQTPLDWAAASSNNLDFGYLDARHIDVYWRNAGDVDAGHCDIDVRDRPKLNSRNYYLAPELWTCIRASWKTTLVRSDSNCLLRLVPHESQGNVTFLLSIDYSRDIAAGINCFTVDGSDYITCFDARLGSWSIFSN